ncbi:1-aminocyclopropane-1-carboxylate deaminase/D-cysteine desulfhydrase [Dyadobacter crusticola]|uniref:1-aminocyclopropane-1-carboxylate deaminase/D-cysteine desulfhydrase n=1 Tax=Dyadobacter crusticola TaxID=292407 RepID=UPI0004E0C801|nr:pyridoxal-phosphate dependent enzyme [Dyadobacter crusticola]
MDFSGHLLPTPLQELLDDRLEKAGVQVFVKRDDLVHPEVSGNKWRKLKFVLKETRELGVGRVLTFGGAYSNHLYAVAAAGREMGLETIGVVRGEQPAEESATLKFCRLKGMQLHFVSRGEYKQRQAPDFLARLSVQFGKPYIIPEGGTTSLALPGVRELVTEVAIQLGKSPDYYCVAAGTGGTAAGILSSGANLLAFPVLKGDGFLRDDILNLTKDLATPGSLELHTDYHFGGYAKWNPELLAFIDDFKTSFGIQLEQVYTGKMFYGLFDLIQKGHFPKGSVIVAVHTGGLQGLLRR